MTSTPDATQTASLATPHAAPAETLRTARRLVVKVGSALLVDDKSGQIRKDWMAPFADDLAKLRGFGMEIVIVSSGAIASGRRHLGLTGRTLKLEEKQAASATGQIRLAHAWQEELARHALTVAQVLVTAQDTENRQHHLNARATINTLLRLGAIPVINENDAIATDEIKVGDNDRLAARVAQMISADTLVLLSDIKGLYTANPNTTPDARFVPKVEALTPEIEAMAGGAISSGMSTGGMITKLMAARIAMSAGCRMLIGLGRVSNPLSALINAPAGTPEAGTWFMPSTTPTSARKKWIAGHVHVAGHYVVDDGAKMALSRGKSLLPAGVTAVEGTFERGDVVAILDSTHTEIGRGLSAYPSDEASLIRGHQSGEIDQILGPHGGRDVLIHRDDMVLADKK